MTALATAAVIAILCTEVSDRTCKQAAAAWNEAAGSRIFAMADAYPACFPHCADRTVVLQRLNGIPECGLHTKEAAYHRIQLAGRVRCRGIGIILHELGHVILGPAHTPLPQSIMRPDPDRRQTRPALYDIHRLHGTAR